MKTMRNAFIWFVVVATMSAQGEAAQEIVSAPPESLVQQRASLFETLDEMSRIGGRNDPVMKSFDMRINAASDGLVQALGGNDASLDEVRRSSTMMELLVESKKAYAEIEQFRARLVLGRVGRRVRDLGGAGHSEVTEAKLQEAEKLLQDMGSEQAFFDKAREQWQALRTALGADESGGQAAADVDLAKVRDRLRAAREAVTLCGLIATVEHLHFAPSALPFDTLMKEEGIDDETATLQRDFVEKESVDMDRMRAVAAKLEALMARAKAIEKSDATANELFTPEQREPR